MNAATVDRQFLRGIRISFLLLIFFLPLVLSTRSSEVFELPKMLFVYAMMAVIAGLWLGRMALRREILIRRTPLDIPILLVLISQMASTIYSIDPHVSWWGWYGRFHGGLWSTISYTFLYYAFVSNLELDPNEESPWRTPKRLLFTITASAIIVSVYAILQHFGIDKDFWVQDVVNRVFSTQGQPNWLAGYLVMIIPFTWMLMTKSKKQKAKSSGRNNKIVFCSLFFVFLTALLFTKSRSGLVGLAAADLTFWLVSLAKTRTKAEGRRPKVKEFVFIHLTMLALLLVTNNPVREMLLKNGIATVAALPRNDEKAAALEGGITLRKSEHGGTESGDIRRLVWSGAIQLVKQRPVFGFGPETFGETYWRVRPKEHNLTSEWNFLYNKAHNEWLNLAANTGVFGLGAHLLLLGWFSAWVLKGPALPARPAGGPRQGRALSSYAIMAALVGVEVVNFFGFSTVTVGAYRYLFMALAVSSSLRGASATKQSQRDCHAPLRRGFVGLAMTGGLVVAVFYLLFQILVFFIADLAYNRGRAYAEAGYIEEAIEPLMRAVKMVPREPMFRAELAEAEGSATVLLLQQRTENREQKSDNLERTVLPSEGQSLLEMAFDLKNDSLANFEIVRKQSSQNLGVIRTEARVMFLLGEEERAVQLMKLAITMAPTNPQLPYSLGTMLTKMGQEEAAVYYNKAVELKPDYQEALKILNIEY